MSMWTRVYRAALLVCALALLLFSALLTVANQRQAYRRETDRALSEHATVRRALETAIAVMASNGASMADMAPRLPLGYASPSGAMLALLDGDAVLGSTMDPALAHPFYDGDMAASLLLGDGARRVLMVQGPVSAGGYRLTLLYARYLDDLYAQGRRWGLLMGGGCLAALALLALALRVALKRALKPLADVGGAAERIAGGDYAFASPQCGVKEIDQLSGSLNRMAQSVSDHIRQLNRRNRAQRQLVADLAHEIKTPMSAVIGYARLLTGASIPEDQARLALSYIASEGQRLEQLSLRLMDLAALEQGAALQWERVDAGQLVDGALAALAVKIQESGRAVRQDVSDAHITCDRQLMVCLLVNLIDNALKYAPRGADIWVRARQAAGKLSLLVCDPGHAVPGDMADQLKQPFFTLDKARSRQWGGAGLGLSLCQRIAQAHGGQLILRSDESGFTAGVVLPVEHKLETGPEIARDTVYPEPDDGPI